MVNIYFVLLHMAALLILFLMIYIIRLKDKNKLQYLFLSKLGFIFIWSFGHLLEIYTRNFTGLTNMIFVYIYLTGVIYLPLSLLFVGLVYADESTTFKKIYIFPFISQTITFLIMITNEYHHLFLIKYSPNNSLIEYGWYFKIHTLFAYLYIFTGLYYLLKYSISSSGKFSVQSIIIFLSIAIPLSINVPTTLKIISLPTYSTSITSSFTAICLFIAIIKFDFLKAVPIPTNLLFNTMDDAIITINEKHIITASNKKFKSSFSKLEVGKILGSEKYSEMINKIKSNISKINDNNKIIKFEYFMPGEKKHYFIEIILYSIKRFKVVEQHGFLIVFKDITEIKKLNQKIVEQEKMATLGILSGGIAHDINNPASSIDSGLQFLKLMIPRLAFIKDNDERNSLQEKILKGLDSNRAACTRIMTLVRSIKNQTRNLSSINVQDFQINKLIDDILLMTSHKFKKSGCTYEIIENVKFMVRGDYTKLSQVVTNLIINAIEAYDDKPGKILIILDVNNDNSLITISDKAGGIKNKSHDSIFKDIISTKPSGTGLGLYISHKIITGDFGGELKFTTKMDIGTDFIISLPKQNKALEVV